MDRNGISVNCVDGMGMAEGAIEFIALRNSDLVLVLSHWEAGRRVEAQDIWPKLLDGRSKTCDNNGRAGFNDCT